VIRHGEDEAYRQLFDETKTYAGWRCLAVRLLEIRVIPTTFAVHMKISVPLEIKPSGGHLWPMARTTRPRGYGSHWLPSPRRFFADRLDEARSRSTALIARLGKHA
jgi:hypothetical protein